MFISSTRHHFVIIESLMKPQVRNLYLSSLLELLFPSSALEAGNQQILRIDIESYI